VSLVSVGGRNRRFIRAMAPSGLFSEELSEIVGPQIIGQHIPLLVVFKTDGDVPLTEAVNICSQASSDRLRVAQVGIAPLLYFLRFCLLLRGSSPPLASTFLPSKSPRARCKH